MERKNTDALIEQIKRRHSPEQNHPRHCALLDIVVRAKNEGSLFADQALAELENLTGRTFKFVHMVSFDYSRFELVPTS